jgi:hypothetical protein
MSRTDRVAMQIALNEDVKAVLEFMQANIETVKLVGVADSLPQLARLLWDGFPQEPCTAISLELSKTGEESQKPQASTESSPGQLCVGGDSVAEAVCR